MKKFIAVLLMLLMVTSVFAGKKFRRLGRYTDVEIIKVTAKGIHISHSDGISIITDRGLSSRDRKNLSAELAQYRRLKNANAAVSEKRSVEQTDELNKLMQQLPKMSPNEIDAWVKSRFKIRLDDKNFRIVFNRTYAYAENKDTCYNALIKRAVAAQQEEIDQLLSKMRESSLEEAHNICRRMFGRPLSDPMFRRNFEERFYMIKDHNNFFREVGNVIARLEEERRREIERRRQEEERRRQEEERRRQEEERRRNEATAKQYYSEIFKDFVNLANNYNRDSESFLRRLIAISNKAKFIRSYVSISQAHHDFFKVLINTGERAGHYFEYLRLCETFRTYGRYSKAQEMIYEAKRAHQDVKSWFNLCVQTYNRL